MSKKMKKIIFLFFLISLTECLNHTQFCNENPTKENELECFGEFSYACGGLLCSQDETGCKGIHLFNSVVKYPRKGKTYRKYKHKLESLLKLVKDCPEYKWNSNDICLNANNCFRPAFVRFWPSKMKPMYECKCNGKYKYKCNRDYCARDKRACHEIKQQIIKIKNIKKCTS